MESPKTMRQISNYFTKLFARVAYVIGFPFIVTFMIIVGLFEPLVYVITGISLLDKTCVLPIKYDRWFNEKFGIKTLNY